MLVAGELKKAQLELLSSAPTPTPTGRMYADITSPLVAVPKFYNGTSWKTLAFEETVTFVTQNSGKACTVNWANGLNQQVVLTDNAVISFQNPQEGRQHNLLVKQNVAVTGNIMSYIYKFNMPDQDVGRDRGPYQPLPIPINSEKMHVWKYKAGAITAYNNVPATWTAAAPANANTPQCGAMSADGKWVSYGTGTTPFISSYGLVDACTNFVSPFTNPSATPVATAATVVDLKYSPDGRFIFVASGTTPFLQGYWTNNNGGNNLVLSNPGTLPTGVGRCVDVHPLSAWVVIGHSTSPFISCYPLVGGAYGTKITDPVSLPAANVNGAAWSPLGDYLACCVGATPFLEVYRWDINTATGAGTFGPKVSAPSPLPVSTSNITGKVIAWRPQGDYIAMATQSSPYLYVVPFNRSTGTFGTPLTITALSNVSNCVDWSLDGNYLIVGTTAAPFAYVYDFSAQTIGTALTLDVTAPATNCMGIALHPSSAWAMWVTLATPKVSVLNLPNPVRNYVRLV